MRKYGVLLVLLVVVACGGVRPTPPQPVPMKDVLVYVYGENDQPVVGALVKLDGWAQGTTDEGVATFKRFPVTKSTAHIKVTADGYETLEEDVVLVKTLSAATYVIGRQAEAGQVQLNALKSLVVARKGVVHVNGRQWSDDGGEFYPLGGTLMWAIRGMKFDQARLETRNLALFKKHHFDYIRILGEVEWPGNDINPNWEDYQTQLASLIDLAYEKYGLRVELTMIGGGTGVDYHQLAQKVADVVVPRQEKVISLEISNEFQIKDARLQVELLQYLKSRLTIPIALTDARNAGLPEVDGTKQFFDLGQTYGTLHLDRGVTKVDGYWRPVRQTWDFKEIGRALSANEPIGPLSSVAADSDPIRLAFNRAVSILNGVSAWVLHNGAGVSGQIDPIHHRPANVDEVENIDHIMDVVRGLDQYLPKGMGDWQHYNYGWAGEPLVADSIWIDGTDHGVMRQYSAKNGNEFISMPLAIKNYVNLRATYNCEVDVIDVVDGVIDHKTLAAGEIWRLEPHTRASDGMGAFILHGFIR